MWKIKIWEAFVFFNGLYNVGTISWCTDWGTHLTTFKIFTLQTEFSNGLFKEFYPVLMSVKHSVYVSGKKIQKYKLTVRVLFFSLVSAEMVWPWQLNESCRNCIQISLTGLKHCCSDAFLCVGLVQNPNDFLLNKTFTQWLTQSSGNILRLQSETQRFYVKCEYIYLYLLLCFYLHKKYTEVISQLHLYMKCDKKSENTQ